MKNISVQNKKARFNYEILDTYTAGIVLVGSEVKSIRENNAVITESYCSFASDGLFIKNMYVSDFKGSDSSTEVTTRDRKLLLNKKELSKIQKSVAEKGNTIIPLKLFITEKGFVKVLIGIGKGKNKSDKRNSLKESDTKREIDRERNDV